MHVQELVKSFNGEFSKKNSLIKSNADPIVMQGERLF